MKGQNWPKTQRSPRHLFGPGSQWNRLPLWLPVLLSITSSKGLSAFWGHEMLRNTWHKQRKIGSLYFRVTDLWKSLPWMSLLSLPKMSLQWVSLQRMSLQSMSLQWMSSTFCFWGTPRTTVSFSHPQFSLFKGSVAQKFRFHIWQLSDLRQSRTKCVFER